jgi:dimethylargininase
MPEPAPSDGPAAVVTHPAIGFRRAILRAPPDSAVNGLRAEDTGPPDIVRMRADHADYAAALAAAGAAVSVLDPLEAFPDSLFVEDTALCLPEGAVLMRPGAPSRMGEVAHIAPALAAIYPRLRRIEGPGHVEGGDILFTGREVLAGLSARTDAAGLAELDAVLAGWGHALRVVETPPGVLHFKTDCSLLDTETVLATRRLAATGCFAGYRVLSLPDDEAAAANTIRVNDVVIMPAGFPRTADLLDAAGYEIRQIGNAECAKLDGGMSCLSLRIPV